MFRRKVASLVGLGTLVLLFAVPARYSFGQGAGPNDAQIEADVHKALDNKKFQEVSVSVRGGNVILGARLIHTPTKMMRIAVFIMSGR